MTQPGFPADQNGTNATPTPGANFPGPAAPAGHAIEPYTPQEQVMVGPIVVTRDYIQGPQGTIPAQGSQIVILNATQMTRGLPTWALVVAIVGFFIITIFSLLFLLVKEDKITGGYEVRVTGAAGGMLSALVPVDAQNAAWQWNDLHARADAARRLINR